VSKHRGTSYRKAGRLITATFHPTVWHAEMVSHGRIVGRKDPHEGEWREAKQDPTRRLDFSLGRYYQSRADGAHAVIRAWLEAREEARA
jgi:hypothetical protein